MSKKGWLGGEDDAKGAQKFMEACSKKLLKRGVLESDLGWTKNLLGFLGVVVSAIADGQKAYNDFVDKNEKEYQEKMKKEKEERDKNLE